MTPRTQWLRERTKEVVAQLQRLESIDDYAEYKKLALSLAKELYYAVTEWEKYYNEEECHQGLDLVEAWSAKA